MTWTISVVVVDDASRSILLEEPTSAGAGGAPRLPSVELPDGEPSVDVQGGLVERLLGRPAPPIWLFYEEADDDLVSGIGAVMVAGDAARDSTAGRHFAPAEPLLDGVEPRFLGRYLRAWLERVDGRGDPRTQSWLEPGWHGRVSGWISERMAAAGMPPTGPSTMSYQSPIGTVLRTPAGDRDVYLKCPAPMFRAEATITRALAARTPGWVPVVIDIEPSEGWLLMADHGDRQLGNEPEAAWSDGLRRLGEIQRAWVGNGEELIGAGGQHRSLAALANAVPGLLDIDGFGGRLDAAAVERWEAAQPRLVDACHELQDIGLPEALIHGDAHPWNVARATDGLVVFDWSDAAIGPSFVDLSVFLGRAKDLAGRRALRDAYLEAWSGVAPRARLERATEIAMSVGALYQVMTYLTLLPGLPPEDQAVWAGADAHWLRNAIEALDRGLDMVDQRVVGA